MLNQTNPVADAINIVSGAYATPFVDALHEICGDESMQGICHAIAALGEEERTIEAVQLIRALMDIANIEYPEELILLEENESGGALFVKEFVADLNDILYSN
ncbi:MAG: hypothetical protein LBS90_04015 [Oscillospiraceae bacterium]|jgi:hypothetical protein|nr:hypothetical protein [Oscillospiraceae bacterium]